MDQGSNLPREPPRLYSSVFIARALNCNKAAVPNAVLHETLRPFGKLARKGQGKSSKGSKGGWSGAPIYACTAVQVSQWIARRWRKWAVTPAAMECWFDGLIDVLRKAGELPPSQEHLESTPYDKLVWVSNYAHHGGRTQEKPHDT